MNTNKYKNLVVSLVANGVDFSKDVLLLDHSELTKYSDLAREYGYKKPLLHSRGFGFYMLLQKVYNKLKRDNDFINSVAERVRMKTVFGIK